MQQRQPRLGDVLDDYCPRERRLTNHVVVAMIGDTIKQTRCTTCDADHEYKHAAIPRQRKKTEQSALYSQVLAGAAPKRIVPPAETRSFDADSPEPALPPSPVSAPPPAPSTQSRGAADFEALFASSDSESDGLDDEGAVEEGPAHRRLIRAQLPRHEGQVSTARQAPDFTIRQPANARGKRFAPRNRSGVPAQGNRQNALSNHNGNNRGGAARGNGNSNGRPGGGGRPGNHRSGGGRNRPK